ncbi:VacJ family lipoprotein [Sphingosinicellaceae bacterium]|nr:VacJ family lipoprotein [Sphingosinicellaceae bacterium]
MVIHPTKSVRRIASRTALGGLVFTLSACAAPHPGSNAPALRDPYEKFNRSMYGFNKGLDRVALKPATKVYRFILPTFIRRGVTNFLNNLEEPLSFGNALLQAKPKEAWHTFKRFTVNTTVGVGGLFDHASKIGLPVQAEDFGQTLAVWGVKSGPFLMLPLFGPSTFRDAGGMGVDFVTDPVPYARNAVLHPSFAAKAGQAAVGVLDLRSKLMDAGADGVLASSLDEYATVRSAFLQRRQSEIYDGSPPDDEDAPVEDAPLAPGATPPAHPGSGVASPIAPAPTGAPQSDAAPAEADPAGTPAAPQPPQ